MKRFALIFWALICCLAATCQKCPDVADTAHKCPGLTGGVAPVLRTGGAPSTGGAIAAAGKTSSSTGGQSATGGEPDIGCVNCPGCLPAGMKAAAAIRHPLGRRPKIEAGEKLAPEPVALNPRSVFWQPNDPSPPENDNNATDQGQIGGCTGFGLINCLTTAPFTLHGTVTWRNAQGLSLYKAATLLDSFPGSYPPNDTGSTVLAAMQAGINAKLLSGYQSASTWDGLVALLQTGPGEMGTDWLEGMFRSDNCGNLDVSGAVAGGHAYEILSVDIPRQRAGFMQSWGNFGTRDKRGRSGYFYMTRQQVEQLLKTGGEARFPTPLKQ